MLKDNLKQRPSTPTYPQGEAKGTIKYGKHLRDLPPLMQDIATTQKVPEHNDSITVAHGVFPTIFGE